MTLDNSSLSRAIQSVMEAIITFVCKRPTDLYVCGHPEAVKNEKKKHFNR